MAVEQGDTNILVGAAFSVADGVGRRADTFASFFDKAIDTREVAGVSGRAFGGSVIGISTLATIVLNLGKTP